jgi:hypothetical protein
MFWKGAFFGLSFETHPSLGGDVDVDPESLKDMIEDYQNGLQRWLALTGMSAKTLAPQVVDPTPHIERQIEAICIKLGVPKRVFMGSERGELASTQDDKAWNDRLRERQTNYLTPRVIVPFVDRLILLGVLPKPNGYSVWWPDITSQSDTEKANVALKMTQALAQYAGTPDVSFVIPELYYLTRILKLDENEVVTMLEEGLKKKAEMMSSGEIPSADELKKGRQLALNPPKTSANGQGSSNPIGDTSRRAPNANGGGRNNRPKPISTETDGGKTKRE